MDSPKALMPYISEPRESLFRPVTAYRSELTREEALQDLEEMRYLMENRYAGWEYFHRQGMDFAARFARIEREIQSREEISVAGLCRAMRRAFDGIVDNHLSFASPLTGRLHFSKQYLAYFADFLVEETQERLIVIASHDPSVPVGANVEADRASLFPALSPTGKHYYYIGIRSWEPSSQMELMIGGKPVPVSLHRCRAGTGREEADVCLAQGEEDGIPIVRSNCCDYTDSLTKDTDIRAIGERFESCDRLIFDNTGNEGGYTKIPREFFLGLNGYVHAEEYWAKLLSPVTDGRDCPRRWEVHDAERSEPEKGTYPGTLYFLMNGGTASSGETSVLLASSLRRAVFIGEKTMGCNTFGNVASYSLSHSGIVLRIPNIINLCANPGDCEEGKGFPPDFWVDSHDIRLETVRWLNGGDGFIPAPFAV